MADPSIIDDLMPSSSVSAPEEVSVVGELMSGSLASRDKSEPTSTARETLSERAQRTYGFEPGLDRAAILPFAKNQQGETEFAWPQIAVDLAQSALLPGHVWAGGQYTPEDVTKMALDFGMPGRAALSRGRPTKKQFIKQSPTRDALKKESRGIYDDVKTRGVVIPGVHSKQLVANLRARLHEEGADSVLHPKAIGILEKWVKKTQDAVDMSFGELEIMRRQAGTVAKSLDPDERRLGGIMKSAIDDYMDRLPDVAGIKKARSLWRRNAKLQDIEEIFFKAENAASGFENGLRNGFRALLNNKKLRKNYTQSEIRAMKKVINGGPWRAFLRTIRHLGPGTGSENRYLGMVMGSGGGALTGSFVGGPVGGAVGAVAAPVAGHVAGRLARRSTTDAADLVKAIVASGGQKLDIDTVARALGRLSIGAGRASPGAALGTQVESETERRRGVAADKN